MGQRINFIQELFIHFYFLNHSIVRETSDYK